MKKILVFFLLLLVLPLIGVGCDNKLFSFRIGDQNSKGQQEQLDDLNKKIEDLSKQNVSANTVPSTKTIIREVKTKETSNSNEEIVKLQNQVKELETQAAQKLTVTGASQVDYATFIPYVVKIKCSDGSGSGTIVSPSTILTNFHVVEKNKSCLVGYTESVENAPNRWSIGEITGINPSLDKAIVTVNGELTNKTIKKCNAADIKIADELVILGYPSVGGNTITITNGIVSGFEGQYIKTSAKINPGNSGGAAIHKSGCYLGIPSIAVTDIETIGLIINETVGFSAAPNPTTQTAGSTNNNSEFVNPDVLQEQQLTEQRNKLSIFYSTINQALSTLNQINTQISSAFNTQDYHSAETTLNDAALNAKISRDVFSKIEVVPGFESEVLDLKNFMDLSIRQTQERIKWDKEIVSAKISGTLAYADVYFDNLETASNLATIYRNKAAQILDKIVAKAKELGI